MNILFHPPGGALVREDRPFASIAGNWSYANLCLFVVDRDNKYVGIIGVADKNRFVDNHPPGDARDAITAGMVANRNASVIRADVLDSEACRTEAERMFDLRPAIAYLPVLDTENIVLGTAVCTDRTRWWGTAKDGEQWSDPWGNTAAKWHGCIRPRIAPWLPTDTVLELGMGRGRWAKCLIPEAKNYIGLEPDAGCVAFCRERFANCTNAAFQQNDGSSFPMIGDESCDLVFSVDSLYVCAPEVVESNIRECLRVLRPERNGRPGVAFLQLGDEEHGTDAGRIRAFIEEAGGVPLLQERVNWRRPYLSHCFTLFSRIPIPGHTFRRIVNTSLMAEAEGIREHILPYLIVDETF